MIRAQEFAHRPRKKRDRNANSHPYRALSILDLHTTLRLVSSAYRSAKKAELPLRERRESITIRADGGLKLAVVADTHSHPHPNTTQLLTAEHPDAILHAGDIGDLKVLAELEKIAPLYAIRGNIDEVRADLPDILDIDLVRTQPDSRQ